jgi:hypothetical protein
MDNNTHRMSMDLGDHSQHHGERGRRRSSNHDHDNHHHHHRGEGGIDEPLVFDPSQFPPEIVEALCQLDPERQRRAIELLLAEQLQQQQQEEEEEEEDMTIRPKEHFLTIALNGAFVRMVCISFFHCHAMSCHYL